MIQPPGVTEHIIHCCGYAQRYLTGIVGPNVELGQEIDWSVQEKIRCRHCGGQVTRDLSGSLMSAYRLGGWLAITEPSTGLTALEGKLIEVL